MLSELAVGFLGCLAEGVVGPVHQGILAEHGSHLRNFGIRKAPRKVDYGSGGELRLLVVVVVDGSSW